MAPDGKSFLTSVGTQDITIWIHDKTGNHQLSSEGSAFATTFSRDGSQLYFLKRSARGGGAELWRLTIVTGQNEQMWPGYEVEVGTETKNYALSPDGTHIVFVRKSENGLSNLWIAPMDRRASPRHLEARENEDSPAFLANGDIVYRATRGDANYLLTRKLDGTGEKKIVNEPILDFFGLSPSGKWALVGQKEPTDEDRPYRMMAFPLEGGPGTALCRAICIVGWDSTETHLFLNFLEGGAKAYFLTMGSGGQLPKVPPNGLTNSAELSALQGVTTTPEWVESMITPDVYSFTRVTNRRNLYRIPIP